MLWSTAWFLPFPCFFFFLEKYTKRQERFCYFLMKTLLTLKYPVFIRVTNSNSKVHPFIDVMWRRSSSGGILGKGDVQGGDNPASWQSVTSVSVSGWCKLGEVRLASFIWKIPPSWSQTVTLQVLVAGQGASRRYSTKITPWQWSSETGICLQGFCLLPQQALHGIFPVTTTGTLVIVLPSYNGYRRTDPDCWLFRHFGQ